VADRVVFLRPDAERIARAVRAFENGDRNETPLTFRRVAEAGRQRDVFRICTFTGAWSIDAAKTVTFKNQTTTPNTVSAVNLFWPVPDGDERDCAIGKEGTAWYLIVPRMYAADAATAASVTTSAIEFQTLPVVALATSGTATFSVSIVTQTAVSSAQLGTASLSFSSVNVGVLFTSQGDTFTIPITTCATATASP
jgi:hypothetical protein